MNVEKGREDVEKMNVVTLPRYYTGNSPWETVNLLFFLSGFFISVSFQILLYQGPDFYNEIDHILCLFL